jgi:RNAse (barnase) inhibitor barstar
MTSRMTPSVEAVLAAVDALRDDGLDAVWVDRAPVFDKTSLLHALYQAIPLPAYFGFNWDALQDALYGSDDPDARPRVLVFRDFSVLEERDAETASMFVDIVDTVSSDPRSTLQGMFRVPATD